MKKQGITLMILGILVCLGIVGGALAASNPAIGWQVISGGGASASGGVITINNTLGQPVIGVSSEDNISLGSGYWYGLSGSIDGMNHTYFPVILR